MTQDVLFTEYAGNGGDLGVITLNRPGVLNALNHKMILAMREKLDTWATATHIKAVIIRAAECRAFCAGGDLRLAYQYHLDQDPAGFDFFRDEYQLNQQIYHFPKPYIALLDGITMGGGAGISINGSHKVATERLTFAMPETSIGFYPDVGGSYFLTRLPDKIGFYLGLTGAKLSADDCVSIGLTAHKVASAELENLTKALADHPLTGDPKQAVTHIIHSFQKEAKASSLDQHRELIKHCFSATTIEMLLERLTQSQQAFAQSILAELKKKSPTSLKVTLQACLAGEKLDFDAVMQQNRCLTMHFLQAHDFIEGIRAVIIDKDQMPQWQPNTLEAVTASLVDQYFSETQTIPCSKTA